MWVPLRASAKVIRTVFPIMFWLPVRMTVRVVMEQSRPVMVSTWNKQRRTHTLSNGEVIWDVSGNAWEWVKDDNSDSDSDSDADNSDNDNGVYGDNAYMSQVTRTSHTTARSLSGGMTTTARVAKDQFGPTRDHSALNSGHHGGLGYGYLNENGGALSFVGVFGRVGNTQGSFKFLWPTPMREDL